MIYDDMLSVVHFFLWTYGYVLIAAAVLSWIPDLSTTPFGAFLSRITDPYMRLFSRLIPSVDVGGVTLNLSYLVGVVVYFILQQTVLNVLATLLTRGRVG